MRTTTTRELASASPVPMPPAYRPDIDGLRAVAVLSVVAYHAFPGWLPGGFLGVDVFFVISGYLISTILIGSLERGSFSLPEFYGRRIRRIVPALLLVLLATYAFGWFNLLADEYMQLGKHVAAGATFVSNLALWSEAGYFDNASETKPLLHLWSLGIEEQFYMAWPLLLWLSWKRKLVAAATVTLVAGSLLASAFGGTANPVAAFYSPLTRLWELLGGSVLAWAVFQGWPDRILQSRSADRVELRIHGLSLLGVALLACGFLFTTGDASFWAKGALVPVAGAALVIVAGTRAWPNRFMLSNRLAVWVGLISFPLYLWHWPLLSFARILAGQTPGQVVRLAAVAVAVVLAWATYRLVEVPIRMGAHQKAKAVACAALLAIVFCIGRYTQDMDGLPGREVVALNKALMNGDDGWSRGNSVDECDIADPARRMLFAHCAKDRRGHVKYALLGDSKAGVLYPGLVRTSTAGARWMFIGGNGEHGSPIPLLSADPALRKFQPLTRAAVEAIGDNDGVRKVVIAAAIRNLFDLDSGGGVGAATGSYDHRYLQRLRDTKNYGRALEGLSATVSRLSAKGKQIVLVVDNPALPDPQDCVGRRSALAIFDRIRIANQDCVVRLEAFDAEIALYRKLLADLSERHAGTVVIFDPTDVYCDRLRGVCEWARDGRLLYSVSDHISDHAAGLVGERLNRFLAQD